MNVLLELLDYFFPHGGKEVESMTLPDAYGDLTPRFVVSAHTRGEHHYFVWTADSAYEVCRAVVESPLTCAEKWELARRIKLAYSAKELPEYLS